MLLFSKLADLKQEVILQYFEHFVIDGVEDL